MPPPRRGPDFLVVVECKTRIDDTGRRHQGRQHHAGLIEEFHTAIADLRHQVGIRTQLVCRKQFDLQTTVGGVANALNRLLRPLVHRVSRILSGREFVRKFSRVSRARHDGK